MDVSQCFLSVERTSAERRFLEADQTAREALLASDIFPGSSAKKVVPFELLGGGTIQGVFEGYRPACVRIWGPEFGLLELPLACIVPELRECFPKDPVSVAQSEIERTVDGLQTALENTRDAIFHEHESHSDGPASDICEAAGDVVGLARELAENVRTVAEENERLRVLTTYLRAKLDALGVR